MQSLHATCTKIDTGESVIQSIRERQPAYNLITNNCQTYALQLLDAIKVGAQKEFGTTLAVYERLKGPGNVKDLFVDSQSLEARLEEGTVSFANQVMHDNTTQLDAKEEMGRGNEGNEPGDDEKHGGNKSTDRGDGGCKSEEPSRMRRFFTRIVKK